jgi:hypothetical protein
MLKRFFKTVIAFPPFVFAILFFASNSVFLVSLVSRDIEFLWPIEYDPKSPVQALILVLLLVFVGWSLLLILTVLVLTTSDSRRRVLVVAIALIPFLAGFLLCEVFVHDLRYYQENAITYVICHGGINLYCLVAEFLHLPFAVQCPSYTQN